MSPRTFVPSGTPVLVDGNSVVMRAAMASAREDIELRGTLTGGVWGAVVILAGVLGQPEFSAGRVYAFFDSGVPAWRRQLLPGYKAKRKEDRKRMFTPEQHRQLIRQAGIVYDIWQYLGVTCLSFKDYEADDVVAAASQVFTGLTKTTKNPPVVVTTDRDLWQTVDYGAHVYDFPNRRLVTEDNFEELVGVSPADYVLYRALVGDPSDSIRGADGYGPKRAAEFIRTLRNDLKGRASANLAPHHAKYWLYAQEKRAAREEKLLNDINRIQSVYRGISLRESFGQTSIKFDSEKYRLASSALKKTLLGPPPSFNAREYLRACGRINFNSPMMYVDAYRFAYNNA